MVPDFCSSNACMTMDERKKTPYAVAVVIQVILATTLVVSKVAFDQGLSTFIYIFYRQAAAAAVLLPLTLALERRNAPALSFRILLKMFLYTFIGSTLGLTLYNTSLKYTSATVGSAIGSSVPVVTFFLALLLRMEVMKLAKSAGIAKLAGVALCLTGVLVIALYSGPSLRPLNGHRVFAGHRNEPATHVSKGLWIAWTFLMLVSCGAWAMWFIFQGLLLKEYPNKLVLTQIQCLFGTVQSGLVAVAINRDLSRWKLGLDLSLLAVLYSGIVGTAASFYLQTWCVDMKGPVFLVMWNPLSLLLTAFCSSLLGETVYLGSILGGILLVGGLYSVLWGKSKEESRKESEQGQGEDEDVDGKERVEEATSSDQQA